MTATPGRAVAGNLFGSHSIMRRRDFLGCSALAVTGLPRVARASAPPGPTECDVVVYGGVPGGIVAAVAAARAGARVVLIEPTAHVGGLNTSGLNTAESEHMLHWTFGGVALEFYERLGRHYGTNGPEFYFESSVAERVFLDMLREAGVSLRQGAALAGLEKDGTRLRALTLSDGSTVAAKALVDASYEGDLMARAGVRYAIARGVRRGGRRCSLRPYSPQGRHRR
jgi:flavin-dependent dehydrogenase